MLIITTTSQQTEMADLQLLSSAAATTCGYAAYMPQLIRKLA